MYVRSSERESQEAQGEEVMRREGLMKDALTNTFLCGVGPLWNFETL